jgi:LPS-assembly lipoprotein
MKNLLKLITIGSALFFLTSCGFHLRNQNELPPQLHTIYFQSNDSYDPMQILLKNSLQGMGINTVDNPQQAAITLNIISSSLTHDNPNVVSSDQATTYNFYDTAIFNLINNKTKQPLIANQTVAFSRTLILQPNEILETSSSVDILKQEMNREMVFRIINILNSKNIQKALNTNGNKTGTTSTPSAKKTAASVPTK